MHNPPHNVPPIGMRLMALHSFVLNDRLINEKLIVHQFLQNDRYMLLLIKDWTCYWRTLGYAAHSQYMPFYIPLYIICQLCSTNQKASVIYTFSLRKCNNST